MSSPQKFTLLLLPLLMSVGCLPELEPVDNGSDFGAFQCDTNVNEAGDDIVDVAVQIVPATICGELDSTGNDGTRYTGDRDNTLFRVNNPGSYTLTLEWDSPDGDYDFYLYDDFEGLEPTPLSYASTEGYPETFSASLQPSKEYLLVVVGWAGEAGAWGVTLQPDSL